MRDFIGKEIQSGDYVVVARKGYRDFVVAKVIDVTPKNVRVVYKASWTNNYPESYLTGSAVKINVNDLFTDQKANADEALELYLAQNDKR